MAMCLPVCPTVRRIAFQRLIGSSSFLAYRQTLGLYSVERQLCHLRKKIKRTTLDPRACSSTTAEIYPSLNCIIVLTAVVSTIVVFLGTVLYLYGSGRLRRLSSAFECRLIQEAFEKMLGPFATASRRTPPVLHCHSPGVATVARRLRIDVHNNIDNNDNA